MQWLASFGEQAIWPQGGWGTEGRRLCEAEADRGTVSQETLRVATNDQMLEEAREDSSLEAPKEDYVALLTPRFWISSIRTFERIHFCYQATQSDIPLWQPELTNTRVEGETKGGLPPMEAREYIDAAAALSTRHSDLYACVYSLWLKSQK